MASRISEEQYKKILNELERGPPPCRAIMEAIGYIRVARMLIVPGSESWSTTKVKKIGRIAVLSAGTSDLPVAEEAAVTAELSNARVDRIYDVGVAGIHRLFKSLDQIRQAQVVVCAAGMDGALPTVVAGLVECPVISVPTSVGYGAAFNGLAPLLTMLNACAPGVSVVNIDNGFGAATMALKILHMINRQEEEEEKYLNKTDSRPFLGDKVEKISQDYL